MNTKEIYSLKLAKHLTNLGFKPIKLGKNPKKPEFDTWIFENTPELRLAMFEYNCNR